MKKKDIYEVTIKIFGIIAACKFIEFLIAGLTVCIAFCLSSTAPKPDLIGVSQMYYPLLPHDFIVWHVPINKAIGGR